MRSQTSPANACVSSSLQGAYEALVLTTAPKPSWGSFNPPGASWDASYGQLSGTPSTDLTGKLSMLAAMLRRRRELPEREVWDFRLLCQAE